jgi:hypothetical protein
VDVLAEVEAVAGLAEADDRVQLSLQDHGFAGASVDRRIRERRRLIHDRACQRGRGRRR